MTAPVGDDLTWLDDLERAHAAATPGEWYVARRRHMFSDSTSQPGIGETYMPADAALIVAAVNALPKLTAALQNVLTGCDHLDRMRPTFSSAEARMAYADATKHIRACLTAALTPESVPT